VKTVWYGSAATRLLDRQRSFNWVADDIKFALATSAYTPDIDADEWLSQVPQVPPTGSYPAGGVPLHSRAITYDSALNLTMLVSSDVFFNAIGEENTPVDVRFGVIYRNVSDNPGQSPLLAFVDFGDAATFTGQALTVVWSRHGALTLQVVNS
jgi:hypothetical protein